jgi:hypothetical protein
VRLFFIENALYWISEFHFDALRLDAVHAILDHSPYTFLEELCDAVQERAKTLNRHVFLFPESAANDSRLVRARDLGGYGFSAQWNDYFHHALRGRSRARRTAITRIRRVPPAAESLRKVSFTRANIRDFAVAAMELRAGTFPPNASWSSPKTMTRWETACKENVSRRWFPSKS